MAGTIDAAVADATAEPRFQTYLLATFSAIAVALAAIGTYGVLAYSVAQRTQEIGVRMALGAAPGRILAGVFARTLAVVAVGLGFGAAAAAMLARFLRTMLFEVEAADPAVLISAAVLFLLTALAAASGPALRASRLDPISALRHE